MKIEARKKDICPVCGHKLKKCCGCGVVQTDENSGRGKTGAFYSSCKECTAKRVLRLKYEKMSKEELLRLKKQHEKVLSQIAEFIERGRL